MGKLAQQAVREARNLQRAQAQGEVMSTHMTVQTGFGWMVRAWHPKDDGGHVPNGRVEKLDAFLESDRGSNRRRQIRDGDFANNQLAMSQTKALSAVRDALRKVRVSADEYNYDAEV